MQNNAGSNIYPTMVKQERHGHEAFIGENFPEGKKRNTKAQEKPIIYNTHAPTYTGQLKLNN